MTNKKLATKIDYTKPAVLDLGAITPLQGATCSTGTGVSACNPGTSNFIAVCEGGGNAGACNTGSLVGLPET